MGRAFLRVVSLVLDAAIQTVGHALFDSTTLTIVADVAQPVFALASLTVGLGALTKLIKWLPNTSVAIRPAVAGGFIAALPFTVGRHLLSFLLKFANSASQH